jgi:LCP family protein required for cell wall assembly
MPAQTATKAPVSVDEPAKPSGKAKKAKRPKRVKAPLWTKLLASFGAVLMIVSGVGMFSVKYFLGKLTDNIQTTSSVLDDSTGSGSTTTAAGKLPDGAMNLLMLGLDTRTGWDQEGKTSRSDTILILHITKAHDQAYMISIPRDMIATIPADKSMGLNYPQTTKINAAYALGSENGRGWAGGAKLATKTVHNLTGIGFDGVVVIDFDGFKGMLEAMGGVYMCVDKDMWSSHYIVVNGKVKYASGADPTSPPRNALWFRKGCRNMEPWEALEFSRLRHSSNGDYDRQRHQQQLLRAMAKKATSSGVMTNPAKVSKIMAAAGSSLKMDTHGVPVTDFVFGLKTLAAADLIPIKTNGGTFATDAGGGGEGVTSATKDLFKATADDKIREFLAGHPEMLISDGSTGS